GVAQPAERSAVNRNVESSSLSPGASSSASTRTSGPRRSTMGVMPLDDDRITERLASLPGWTREGDEIVKTFELPTFPDAITFVTRIADRAEAANHPPDLDIRYRKVRVALSTHDAGGLTEKDFDLATEIEGCLS